MDERAQRIVGIAIELAERDGYAAVRLRDVAAQAGVALGTVYRRFRSKEDILVAALEIEVERLQGRTRKRPPQGDSPLERLDDFFAAATHTLVRRPHLARALIRAMATGDAELTQAIARFHAVMVRLITAALRGVSPFALQDPAAPLTPEEQALGAILQQVWFASLVGWAGGLHPDKAIGEQVSLAAALLLRGAGLHPPSTGAAG